MTTAITMRFDRRRRQSTGELTLPDHRALLIKEDGRPAGLPRRCGQRRAHRTPTTRRKLTPTKHRKLDPAGNQTEHHWLGKCNVCKKKSTQLCSVCSHNAKAVYRKGQICFAEHMQSSTVRVYLLKTNGP